MRHLDISVGPQLTAAAVVRIKRRRKEGENEIMIFRGVAAAAFDPLRARRRASTPHA
jgi:hypothetical protein